MVRALFVFVCLCGMASPVRAEDSEDWPHWRGPRSTGAAAVSHAPDRWSQVEHVVWRTEIEGTGNSSPVIAGRRAYVTTAMAWERRTPLRLVVDSLIGCLALFGVPALALERWKRVPTARAAGRRPLVSGAASLVDTAMFVLLAVAVLGFGLSMAFGPRALDVGLHTVRDLGVTVARSLGRVQTNLSFLTWTEAARSNRWIISSAMALAALGLSACLVPARSMARVVSALALLVGVALSYAYVPWPEAYGDRVPTGILVVCYAPVVTLALWHLCQYGTRRLRGNRQDDAHSRRGVGLSGLMMPALSLAMFVSPNYLAEGETVITRRLLCVDAVTGRKIWHADAFETRPEATSAMNSYATPTPTVAGDIVVAAFGPGVAAFTLDGHRLWSRMFPGWIEGSVYGAGSSPVVHGDTVFMTNDREYDARRQSQVIAYALKTGAERWRQSPAFAHDGYATSLIHHDGEQTLLVTLTSKALVGYVASSGEMAWRQTIPMATPIPSLIAEGDTLYVTGGLGGGYTAALRVRPNAAPTETWTSQRSPADVSSPVLYKGRLFTITSTGVMVCYDAESGEVIWRTRVGSGLGVFYSSLVAADDKVYATRSNGTTYVIAAEDTFRLIAESSLPGEVFATPAFASGCLFLRTASSLYCIRSST